MLRVSRRPTPRLPRPGGRGGGNPPGVVYLVGAGPGNPELITVRGLKCLQRADVVVYDRLVSLRLLDEAPPSAERIDVGKAPGRPRVSQAEINALLVEKAKEGRRVVRLKGGDPFVFGRGGEECEALAEAGVPYEVVPGVSSAIAAPAYAGIPLTHRCCSSAFTVVTGHRGEPGGEVDWGEVPRTGTLVVLMGVGRLREIAEALIAHGRSPDTPAAVVSWGTTAAQEEVQGTLADIPERAEALRSPAVIVVGEVVALREKLAWLDPPSPGDREPARPVLAAGEAGAARGERG